MVDKAGGEQNEKDMKKQEKGEQLIEGSNRGELFSVKQWREREKERESRIWIRTT